MLDLFAFAPRQTAPAKTTRGLSTTPVRFASGWCNAACIYATGPDCECPCLGRNHQAGLRCDGFEQEDMGL